jgi:hypothetical protein
MTTLPYREAFLPLQSLLTLGIVVSVRIVSPHFSQAVPACEKCAFGATSCAESFDTAQERRGLGVSSAERSRLTLSEGDVSPRSEAQRATFAHRV